MTPERALPSGTPSRLLQFGRLAGGLLAGMAAEGARRLASGDQPRASDLLLTPKNAARVADRLSELRGAAMKVGQLLSMEAGHLLPPDLSSVLARLREDAHRMPLRKHGVKSCGNMGSSLVIMHLKGYLSVRVRCPCAI